MATRRRDDGPDLSGKAVLWLDRGWQPANIGFCPSRRAWKKEMRRMGVKNAPPPTASGNTSSFESNGSLSIIVFLAEGMDRANSRIQIAGLIAHEATHVWQAVRDNMGEKSPSAEFEAYSVQAIFQCLYRAWFDTRGHLVAPDVRSI